MKRIIVAAAAALVCFSSHVAAQIVVDGQLDEGYQCLSVQTNNTQFGNQNCEVVPAINGSELCALYSAIEDGRLYVMLTGNLEFGNFNKLEVLLDSVEGGENVLSGTPGYDFFQGDDNIWNSQRLGNILNPKNPGWTMDEGFTPDYHVFFRLGNVDGVDVFDATIVNRMGGTSSMVPGNEARVDFDFDSKTGVGVITSADLGPNASGPAIAEDVEVGIVNSNSAGVGDFNTDPDLADEEAAKAVTTGIEFSVALSDLGIGEGPTANGVIKIMAAVNNADHSYLSNQFLPGLPVGQGNLGGDPDYGTTNQGGFIGDLSLVDMNLLEGDQFACIALGGCDNPLGDVNLDGFVTLLDVDPFVNLLTSSQFQCEADVNGDGQVTLLDVDPFVALLTGG